MSIRAFVMLVLLPALVTTPASAARLNDRLTLTVTERLRFVSWNNTVTLNEWSQAERAFTRHRTVIGSTWRPHRRIELGLALANEFRYYLVPQTIETDLNEVFVDQLYVAFDKIYDYPLTLTVGRQNITLGEGFVMMDGGPLDGSRSIYFNAVRADWTFGRNRTLTLFAVSQKETDRLLPILNDQEQAMVEQPERAVGVYYSGLHDRTTLEAYYIYKQADSNAVLPLSHIHTIGARLILPLREPLDLTIECARQLGDRGERDREALGSYAYLTFRPPLAKNYPYLPSMLTAGVIYLSGGADGSNTWKDWDPVFSRWPKWSESYIYTQVQEDRVGYWTNLTSLYGKVNWNPDDRVAIQFAYHRLDALKQSGSGLAFPGGTGEVRGDLLIGKVTYEINPRLTGHIVGESFRPGNYYFRLADPYFWLRTELLFKW
jgi:hypothetical protein